MIRAFTKSRQVLAAFSLLAVLSGCSGSGGWGTAPTTQAPAPVEAPQTPVSQGLKVGLLLPLNQGNVGMSMMNAGQLAIHDLNAQDIALLPKDTGSSAAQAAAAAQAAIDEGAQVLIGPLFADAVRAVAPVARAKNIPVVALSTDTSVAGNGVYLISIPPNIQVERIVRYAASKGRRNFVAVVPADAYGDNVAASMNQTLQALALPAARVIKSGATRDAEIAALRGSQTDAVLLALPAADAARVSAQLDAAGLNSAVTDRLGLGIWDDAQNANVPALRGALFAAPSPRLRRAFVDKYQETFGAQPERLATLVYDAVALATVLNRQGFGVSNSSLQMQGGFSGLDGIFRFKPDGSPQRALAILSFDGTGIRVVEDSPSRF